MKKEGVGASNVLHRIIRLSDCVFGSLIYLSLPLTIFLQAIPLLGCRQSVGERVHRMRIRHRVMNE
jgi:hypothetical protein